MRQVIYCFFFIFLLSCNDTGTARNNAKTTSADSTAGTSAVNEINISGCYMRVVERDTLAASLQQNGSVITGKLSFDNYQKDGSTGTVSGTADGDVLKLLYSFQSEGMNSVMEVFFKISEGGLIHGIGEVAVKGDTAYYVNDAHISYPAKNKLMNLPCEKLPEKYK